MSKQIEALKLAKELDGVIADVEQGDGFDDVCLGTIKYVRDALAEQPAQQEVDWEKLYRLEVKKKEALAAKYERDTGKKLTRIVPMAEQPASKPWVGLTDEEWQEIDASLNGKRDLARIFVRAIEAKLREKNA